MIDGIERYCEVDVLGDEDGESVVQDDEADGEFYGFHIEEVPVDLGEDEYDPFFDAELVYGEFDDDEGPESTAEPEGY